MSDAWDPEQYRRFEAERRQPFDDLVAEVQPVPGGRVLDFGCGTGALTAELRERLSAEEVTGVDSSAAMLTKAPTQPGVRFVQADMATYTPDRPVDVIISNASLHWIPDHASVLRRWLSFLRPGGQLAVQVPANADHPAHRLAEVVAREPAFASSWGSGGPPPDPVAVNVCPPEVYAELLHAAGAQPRVQLRVYPHVLSSTGQVVEWVKGSSLTRFRAPLSAEDHARFLAAYGDRVLATLGARSPFFYPFKRILMWARVS